MTEKFAADRSRGNGRAVDGKIRTAATGRVIMNDSGDDLLTYTILTLDEHAEVCGRHL